MSTDMKTIGVLTSGGDSPGMNAAIRGVVRTAITLGMKVVGVRRGFQGLIDNDHEHMTGRSVSEIIQRGGTILYTARSDEFMTRAGQEAAAKTCRELNLDALVIIGGDGSFKGAADLSDLGINVMCIPGTIDQDISCTEYTIGFDTAVNTAMEAIDKIRDTSTSHERCSIIEVMGRHNGQIALWCGIANGAEEILLPENYDYNEQKIVENIIKSRKKGKRHHIIINAEGVGDSEKMAKRLEAATGISARATILGYMQRGGNPSCKDRVYASIMGAMAVEAVSQGKKNRVIARVKGEFVDIDLKEGLAMEKKFPQEYYRISKQLDRVKEN
ncbi:ATP-dependent 6-phosphofructokinase [Parasporobacterium paucivorans]|uniref:ATP-dependent 6-phosphofructokinase n=1 Tax=Parasporobacterium paucivorans DSM 15970 TaxID=1122934 RepID=A0A1M6JR35_9FIRM|nr:ATP-dependent 6-phosphofructokinase [Parasporobacterium paucivorans]SHJ49083.1 6-phosphofructokinase [Parasporobacterium paucivorans DSM 15970]